MRKSKPNVDNILADLFHKLDHGVIDQKTGKKSRAHKKAETLRDEATKTYKLAPESLKPTKLVLIRRENKCKCCGQQEAGNVDSHILVERVDKHGNVIRNRFFTKTEIQNLPREVETRIQEVDACVHCFLENPHKIQPMVESQPDEKDEMVGTPVMEEGNPKRDAAGKPDIDVDALLARIGVTEDEPVDFDDEDFDEDFDAIEGDELDA